MLVAQRAASQINGETVTGVCGGSAAMVASESIVASGSSGGSGEGGVPGVPGGGHGGSHGQLAHEFVSAILEDRQPLVNVYEALAMTVPGIIAHRSAQKNGEALKVPQYDAAKA